jgi:hypothetical protein
LRIFSTEINNFTKIREPSQRSAVAALGIIRNPADRPEFRMLIAEKSLFDQGFFGEVVSGITT